MAPVSSALINKRKCRCRRCGCEIAPGKGHGHHGLYREKLTTFYYCELCERETQYEVDHDVEQKEENLMAENLIPKNIMDEFKRRMKESRGFDAKRADARRFVYTTMTARFGAPWWNLNREALLKELEEAEAAVAFDLLTDGGKANVVSISKP